MSDIKTMGRTVRDRAARELRNQILTGQLAAGTRIDLDEITRAFGTSRTPVREALLELSYEGLVAIAPRSGITVLGMTAADALDNFAVLAALSGKAAEWAASRITDAEIDELHELAAAVVGADDVVDANWKFHRALNLAARSPRLMNYLRQAVRIVPTNYFELFPEQEETSRTDHTALLDAITRRDAPSARVIAEAHVLHAGEAMGDWLAGPRTDQDSAAERPATR